MCIRNYNKVGICILFVGLLLGCQDGKRAVSVSGHQYLVPEEFFLFKPSLIDRVIGFDDETDWLTLDISAQLDVVQGEQILLTLFSAGTKVPLAPNYERFEEFKVGSQLSKYRKAFRKYESYKWDILNGDMLVGDCLTLNKKIRCHYYGEGLFDEFSGGVYVSFPENLWSRRVSICNVAKKLLIRWRVET